MSGSKLQLKKKQNVFDISWFFSTDSSVLMICRENHGIEFPRSVGDSEKVNF